MRLWKGPEAKAKSKKIVKFEMGVRVPPNKNWDKDMKEIRKSLKRMGK